MCENLKDTRYDDLRNQWNKIVWKEKPGGTWPYKSDWGEQFYYKIGICSQNNLILFKSNYS